MMRNPEVRALLLSAGLGTRLQPLTKNWPKCLMPINGRPLLDYWLHTLQQINVNNVMINTHYLAEIVSEFLKRPQFSGWVKEAYEPVLLGTACSLLQNKCFFQNYTTLLIHADNWSHCDFSSFLDYHHNLKPKHCPITMMTFETDTPQSCGILEVNSQNVVTGFYEKVPNPPGNLANAAVYILEPEVLDWMSLHPEARDFSTEVLPNFIGRIATWHNLDVHRDIGTYSALCKAQLDPLPPLHWPKKDAWLDSFADNPIHDFIKNDKRNWQA